MYASGVVSCFFLKRNDILPVTAYIKGEGYASKFVLWGEGMGAAAACLHMSRFSSLPGDKQIPVTALVLDAFFPKLPSAIWDGIERMRGKAKENPETAEKVSKIPTALVMMAISLIKSGIKSDADFDLDDINPIDYNPIDYNPIDHKKIRNCSQARLVLPH